MGLFDFFFGKKKQAESDVFQQLSQRKDKEPSVHYILAHYALRGFALDSPLKYLGVLASPHARDFLQTVLDDVAKDLPRPDFTSADMHVHPTRVGDFACAIVEFPTPREFLEVYFTALVVRVRLEGDEPKVDDGSARYFTLEKGVTLGGPPRTVLCEWTTTSHLNFGDGPQPTLHGFTEALTSHLDKSR